jgi:hypothetical protein
MSSNTAQSKTALGLVRSGVALQLAGLLWGIVVHLTRYPGLGLTAHIQFMAEGAMVLLVGILLCQSSIIDISALECQIVFWGFAGVWVVMAANCANAYWGAKNIMPIVSSAMTSAEQFDLCGPGR